MAARLRAGRRRFGLTALADGAMRGAGSDRRWSSMVTAKLTAAANLRASVMLALAAVGATPAATVAQEAPRSEAPSIDCLWTSLTPLEQLRLELAARDGRGFTVQDVDWIGDRRIADLLLGCGFQPLADEVALMARYWAAKASIAGKRAALRAAGVDPAAAVAALAEFAPPEARLALAAEIAGRVDGAAAAAIRAAVERVASARGGLDAAASTAAAEFMVAVILADGMASAKIAPE